MTTLGLVTKSVYCVHVPSAPWLSAVPLSGVFESTFEPRTVQTSRRTSSNADVGCRESAVAFAMSWAHCTKNKKTSKFAGAEFWNVDCVGTSGIDDR